MVTVRTFKLKNSWNYKKCSNALRISTYDKGFLIQYIVNNIVRNDFECDH